MAPHNHSGRGGHNTGSSNGPGNRRHRDNTSRNANTGAGVNRRASRGPRAGGHRNRAGRVTPGARLADRITTGDARLVDRMTGGGIRLADRITGGARQGQREQQPLMDRMTGGDRGFQREVAGQGHQRAARARPPRGRVREGQGRSGGQVAPATDRGGAVQGLGLDGTDGHVDMMNNDNNSDGNNNNDNDNDNYNGGNDDWELDFGVKSPTHDATHHSNLFLSSQPTQPSQFTTSFQSGPVHPSTFLSPARPNFPTFPTIPTAYNPHDIPSFAATSNAPIRMLNQPVSPLPGYQFVAPSVPINNGNKYRGKDPIKKMFQNKKLAAILGDKPLPKPRGVSKEEKMIMKM